MDGPGFLQIFSQLGVSGAIVAYLIWRESNDRKDRQAETESRLKLATALEALKNYIVGRRDV